MSTSQGTTPTDEMKADELLLPQFLDRYKAQLNAIWTKLIRTRESMYIVRSISRFPFRKFVEPQDIVFFWQILSGNCANEVILNLHSLVNDTRGKNLNLRRLMKSIREWLRPEYIAWYDEHIRTSEFNSEIQSVATRVNHLRDRHIAHLDWEQEASAPSTQQPAVSDKEMEQLYLGVKGLFHKCCLTAEYVIDMDDYRHGEPQPKRIDKLLNLVAKNSHYVNQPEIRGQWWSYQRDLLSKEELDDLNTWRAKFGLPAT